MQIIIDQDKKFEALKNLKNQITLCRQGRRFIPSDLYSVFIDVGKCFAESIKLVKLNTNDCSHNMFQSNIEDFILVIL